MKKSIHLIIAHPSPESFNYGLKSTAEFFLKKRNHPVLLTDIYGLNKKNHPAVKPYGLIQTEQDHALIQQEQEKIKSSQLTIIQFPLYWFSVPGLLKNYFDTVWELGFAFGPGKFKESPLHDGRQVLFSLTTQSNEQDYSSTGLNGDITKILYPLETAFKFIGFEILPYFVAYQVGKKSAQELHQIKLDFENNLAKIIL